MFLVLSQLSEFVTTSPTQLVTSQETPESKSSNPLGSHYFFFFFFLLNLGLLHMCIPLLLPTRSAILGTIWNSCVTFGKICDSLSPSVKKKKIMAAPTS